MGLCVSILSGSNKLHILEVTILHSPGTEYWDHMGSIALTEVNKKSHIFVCYEFRKNYKKTWEVAANITPIYALFTNYFPYTEGSTIYRVG